MFSEPTGFLSLRALSQEGDILVQSSFEEVLDLRVVMAEQTSTEPTDQVQDLLFLSTNWILPVEIRATRPGVDRVQLHGLDEIRELRPAVLRIEGRTVHTSAIGCRLHTLSSLVRVRRCWG